jgi:hypothetical protein
VPERLDLATSAKYTTKPATWNYWRGEVQGTKKECLTRLLSSHLNRKRSELLICLQRKDS